jgi:predicted ATPase/DNA-binding SARP family transcriptional activator
VEFGVLGPLTVRDGGRELDVRRGLPRTLLVALLLRRGETVTAGALVELLWPDEQPRNPANALQIQVSYLRKVLGPGPIVTRPGGYSLDVDADAVDAVRFERLVGQAASSIDAPSEGALRSVDEALALWRGDPLADVAGEPFARGAATRLEELRWSAHELRNDLLLGLGRHRDVVGDLGRLIAGQPLRERFHEQLMLALYRCGRQADALRAYGTARATLLDELGIDPGPGLQQLEGRILAQDPALTPEPEPDPAPVTAGGGRSTGFIPAPMTALIGRDSEVARIRDLLARSRLVTLTGPGGAGKTRLAIDVAGTEAGDQQVWFVELSAVERPELVAPTVAAAVGTASAPTEDPAEAVAASLAAERGLLVLDTCEHVLSGAAALVGAVLRRAPAMKVLTTSRRPLGVTGEAAWPVPPLGIAEPDAGSVDEIGRSPAVRLFCERAAGVRPGFELSTGNAADVARICLTLDGLPLAIELAAAHADVLSPSMILDRLGNRFDLLVDGSADAAVRQQTLRGTIDWSVGLLTDEQRGFFARLGTFSGGFDLDAAEAVAGPDDGDALGLLAGLVRQSMVVTDGDGRYRLLDTLRAYAVDLLEAVGADADRARHRHALHFAAAAESWESQLRGESQQAALARLRAEVPNFRSALEWSFAAGEPDVAARIAGSLCWFWALDGRLDEASRFMERVLAAEALPALLRAKALWGNCLIVAALGDLEAARDAGLESVDLARTTGDDRAVGSALNATAVALWGLGEMDAAAAAHDEAIDRFASAGDVWGEAICRVLRARTALDQGDPSVEDLLRAGLDGARRCGDVHIIGIALELRAHLRIGQGRLGEALATARESLELQESIGYTEGAVTALHLLARLEVERGDDGEARRLLLRSLDLAWKMRHAAATCEALEDLARLEARRGDRHAAAELLGVAARERARRNLPLRARDLDALADLRSELIDADGPDGRSITTEDAVLTLLG